MAYVFSADMSTLFLTLDQGSVTYYDTHARAETDAHIRSVADAVMGSMDGLGTDPGRIDLGGHQQRGPLFRERMHFQRPLQAGRSSE